MTTTRPTEQAQTLATLEANFKKHEPQLQTGLKWEDVEAELTPEKLNKLQRLTARNGELTLVGRTKQGKLLFIELFEESPTEKRDVNYDQAEAHTKSFGAELIDPKLYETFRDKGIILDVSTWSWLKTNAEIRKTDYAFGGYGGIARQHVAHHSLSYDGLRCSIEV